jgi:hypothetical protein
MAADKYIALTGGQLTNTSAVQAGGAGNAGKVVALDDTTGLLDASMFPDGATATVVANVGTTTVANGDFVYLTAAGLVELAKADAVATIAQGFVLVGDTTGNPVTVYLQGENTAKTSLTIGAEYYLDATTAGKITVTPPATPTNVIQPIGYAVSTSRLHMNRQRISIV